MVAVLQMWAEGGRFQWGQRTLETGSRAGSRGQIRALRKSLSNSPTQVALIKDPTGTNPMGDLINPRLLYLKGGLMLLVGLLAGGLVVGKLPD